MKQFKQVWFIVLGYMLLIKPGCIAGMPELALLDKAIDVFRIALLGITIVSFLQMKIKVNKLLGAVALTMLLEISKIGIGYIHHGTFSGWGTVLNVAGMSLFTYVALITDYKTFLKGCSLLTGSYVLINWLTVILFPGGLYSTLQYTQNFFLSYRTAWFPIYLWAVVVTLLWCEVEKSTFSKVWSGIVIAGVFISMVMVWTATGIACLAIGAIALLIMKFRKKGVCISIGQLFLVEGVAFYLLVIARAQEVFEYFIVTILKKDITMSERLRVWDSALELIGENFWFGVGDLSSNEMRALLGFGVSHAHNIYLNLCLCYGIAVTVIFFFLVYYVNSGKPTNETVGQKKIMMAGMVALLTAGLVESYTSIISLVYPMLLIAASIETQKSVKRRKIRLCWDSQHPSKKTIMGQSFKRLPFKRQ